MHTALGNEKLGRLKNFFELLATVAVIYLVYTTTGYTRPISLPVYTTAGYASSEMDHVYTATRYASNDIDLGCTTIGNMKFTALSTG